MDTGNFLEEPYRQTASDRARRRFTFRPRPTTAAVNGTRWIWTTGASPGYCGDAGYTGYVALEMEGKENPDTAVPKSIAMLRAAFA